MKLLSFLSVPFFLFLTACGGGDTIYENTISEPPEEIMISLNDSGSNQFYSPYGDAYQKVIFTNDREIPKLIQVRLYSEAGTNDIQLCSNLKMIQGMDKEIFLTINSESSGCLYVRNNIEGMEMNLNIEVYDVPVLEPYARVQTVESSLIEDLFDGRYENGFVGFIDAERLPEDLVFTVYAVDQGDDPVLSVLTDGGFLQTNDDSAGSLNSRLVFENSDLSRHTLVLIRDYNDNEGVLFDFAVSFLYPDPS